jgi:hypothetical protein
MTNREAWQLGFDKIYRNKKLKVIGKIPENRMPAFRSGMSFGHIAKRANG